jgi:2'-5' RNA ligase
MNRSSLSRSPSQARIPPSHWYLTIGRSIPLRLFVSVQPPLELSRQLHAELAPHLGGLPEGLRLVPPEQVHLTLQFIGETLERDLDDVTESVARSASGLRAGPVRCHSIAGLPDVGPLRVIAAMADIEPDLAEVQRRLAKRLARSARARSEGRFRPHLTLARIHPDFNARFESVPIPPLSFDAAAISLVRSVLRPTGAQHIELARFELIPPREPKGAGGV